MAEIQSIDELLEINLCIPDYQRPYKWEIRNIQELLTDIENAISNAKKYPQDFKYRIGTIILHKEEQKFNIVDGQQRIISLILLKKYITPEFHCSILDHIFDNKISQYNIHTNYRFINEWFSLRSDTKKDFIDAFANILEVVVICVDNISEAFQLFDSQNTRGKALDPHDLLKAYHLREMKDSPYEMRHAVTKWEEKDTTRIRELFDLYLFPIWNWSRGNKSNPFTVKEIDTYKGIPESYTYIYSYARRAGKAMPYFQITEPFVSGNDFFEMVEHYLNLLNDIKEEIETDKEAFKKINEILTNKKYAKSTGFNHTINLFYCALLCYYDKFHNFDKMAVKKLFLWAFMLRVDMEHLGFDSINKYAIGDDQNVPYTNRIAMFSKINLARLHNEISGLQITIQLRKSENWKELYNDLETIIVLKED